MKKSHLINILLTVITLALLIYLALAFVAAHALGLVYNSDIITPAYLYQSLFLEGAKISQWYYAATMGFFPDFLVYFPLSALVGNAQTALSYFAVYQLLMYFIVIVYLGRSLTKHRVGTTYIFCLSVLLTFLLYDSGYLQQNVFYGMAIGGHFGTACMFLLGIIFINNTMFYSGKIRIINQILLGLLCLLTVFSDLLFLTQFVATATASLLVIGILSEKHKRKVHQINLVIVIIASVFSYLLFRLSKPLFNLHFDTYKHFLQRRTLHDLSVATKSLFYKLQIFYNQNAIIIILLSIFFAVSLVYGLSLFKKRIKCEFVKDEEKPFVFTICMLFTSILTGYCSQIFFDNVLVSNDPSLRSMQPFILFPVFLGIPLYLAYKTNLGEFIQKYYKSIICSILFCAIVFIPMNSIKPLVSYYPPQTQCLDYYAKKYHLKNGVAQYWNAKMNSFLSKEGVNVTAVISFLHSQKIKLEPSLYMDSQTSYIGKQFNFALVDKINSSIKINAKNYGKPIKILDCEEKFHSPTLIYIYPKGFIGKNWKIAPNTR